MSMGKLVSTSLSFIFNVSMYVYMYRPVYVYEYECPYMSIHKYRDAFCM